MIGQIVVFLVNLRRRLANDWRRLLRRRVDYVRIELGGSLPEFAPPRRWIQRRLLRAASPLSLLALRRRLDRIASDPSSRGVILRIDRLTAGWATLQSLRGELARLRSGGKRVVAYLLTGDTAGYYLACAADTIVMPPGAYWSVVGVRAELQFLKDALARYGVEAELEAVSPYKSAGEIFVRSDISPENREQLERLLDQRFAELIRAIAEGRGLEAGAARALIDRLPLHARAAREHGLIDATLYEDELGTYLAADPADGRAPPPNGAGSSAARPVILDWQQARRALLLPYARHRRSAVAVVPIEGTIAPGRSRSVPLPLPLFGGPQSGSETVAQAIRQAERSRKIGAVVLYVNSPGGDSFASDMIWREVLRLRQKKPVVVAMGDVAASGGYYVAAPASAIVAQPATLTGSIGVFSLRPVAAGLLDKAEIHTVVLSRGERSGLLSVTSPLNPTERQALREQVFVAYEHFKERVRSGRGLADEQLEAVAGGRVWTGDEALARGLVDRLGGLPEAVTAAQELAGMAQDRDGPLVLLSGGRGSLQPPPFPSASLLDLPQLLAEELRPRIWAALPLVGL